MIAGEETAASTVGVANQKRSQGPTFRLPAECAKEMFQALPSERERYARSANKAPVR